MAPLRELLSTKNSWSWGPAQEQAFQQVKEELTRPMVLVLYSLQIETKISADSSSYGLGAVLTQRQSANSTWKQVAYASRALTETENRYAQVEKEALACTWAAEKFSDYLLGEHFKMETDPQAIGVFSWKQKFGQPSTKNYSFSSPSVQIYVHCGTYSREITLYSG